MVRIFTSISIMGLHWELGVLRKDGDERRNHWGVMALLDILALDLHRKKHVKKKNW
jgi:hypothetical protein